MNTEKRGSFSYDLLAAWFVFLLLSIGVGFGIYLSAKHGDCAPNEVDGQCGMSTFFGKVYGVFTGTVILAISTACLRFIAWKRRNAAAGISH